MRPFRGRPQAAPGRRRSAPASERPKASFRKAALAACRLRRAAYDPGGKGGGRCVTRRAGDREWGEPGSRISEKPCQAGVRERERPWSGREGEGVGVRQRDGEKGEPGCKSFAAAVVFGQCLLVELVSPLAGGLAVGPALPGVCLLQEGGEGAGVEDAIQDFIGIVAHGWPLLWLRLGSV